MLGGGGVGERGRFFSIFPCSCRWKFVLPPSCGRTVVGHVLSVCNCVLGFDYFAMMIGTSLSDGVVFAREL